MRRSSERERGPDLGTGLDWRRVLHRLGAGLALSWLLSATPVAGQRVAGALSPQVVGAGQAAEYSITIEEGQQIQQLPENLNVPGLEFDGPASRHSTVIVNGVLRQQTEFVWQVYANEAGTYTIPPQSVIVNGQSFSIPARTLQVQEGSTQRQMLDPLLRLHVEKKSIYVGEVVPVTVTAFFHRRTQLRNYEHPKLPRDNFVVKRFPSAGPSASVEINGERYQPIMFSSSLSAIREGPLKLGPATLDCVVDFPSDGQRPSAPGLPSFFQRMATRQLRIESEAMTIEVQPLPSGGRPAGFSGAVGKFSISARLGQAPNVRVGDPLAIDISVAGEGNFDAVAAPVLSVTDGWRTYPPKTAQENRSAGLEPGVMSFTQVIIPQSPATEVPAFQFSYFDPDLEKYVTARTQPIPIQVTPEEKPAAAAGTEAPTRDFSVVDAAIPEEELADILALRPERGNLRPLTPQWESGRWWWAAQAVPAAAILTFAGVGLQRRWRAAAAARTHQRSGQPRPRAAIARDLKRQGVSLRDFYTLVREYLEASPLGGNHAADDSLASIRARQVHYCYGDAPDAAAPVPADERKSVLATLARLEI